MATFGSYGNLGGELVSVNELNSSIPVPDGGTVSNVVFYTVPVGRYALITRIVNGDNSVPYNLTGVSFSVNTGTINNVPISTTGLEMSLLLNEGDSITFSGSQPFFTGSTINALIDSLIFEYRKP